MACEQEKAAVMAPLGSRWQSSPAPAPGAEHRRPGTGHHDQAAATYVNLSVIGRNWQLTPQPLNADLRARSDTRSYRTAE